jgi:hypothetical protein
MKLCNASPTSRSLIQQFQVELLLGVVLLLRYHTQHKDTWDTIKRGKTNPDRMVAAAIKGCNKYNF